MGKIKIMAACAVVLGLSACQNPDSSLERAIVGGAIGCVAGEVLLNGRCVEGGAVGAAAGVVTN